ncbi:hypothetical protein [Nocardioides daejeonensis]|uniref:hypothetical protein n=1 Tax=Nocardioides daejeonensis TaxID=1046556 RepID=UPI000D74FAA7|nr:hypothetical protein [Nocardioides daejeonensis]
MSATIRRTVALLATTALLWGGTTPAEALPGDAIASAKDRRHDVKLLGSTQKGPSRAVRKQIDIRNAKLVVLYDYYRIDIRVKKLAASRSTYDQIFAVSFRDDTGQELGAAHFTHKPRLGSFVTMAGKDDVCEVSAFKLKRATNTISVKVPHQCTPLPGATRFKVTTAVGLWGTEDRLWARDRASARIVG